MALIDQHGNPVSVGDTVNVTGTVENLDEDSSHYVNCTVLLSVLMPPSGAQTRLVCNTTQVVNTSFHAQPSLSPASVNADPDGGDFSFQVDAAGSMAPWTAAATPANWLTVTDPTGPTTGDGTVSYTVGSNTSQNPRDGSIVIDALGLAFSVHQAAGLGTEATAASEAPSWRSRKDYRK